MTSPTLAVNAIVLDDPTEVVQMRGLLARYADLSQPETGEPNAIEAERRAYYLHHTALGIAELLARAA